MTAHFLQTDDGLQYRDLNGFYVLCPAPLTQFTLLMPNSSVSTSWYSPVTM